MSLLAHGKARALVSAHFALDISSRDERQLRLHLKGCAECAAWYERQLLVASLDPKAPTAERRLAAGLGLKPKGAAQTFSLQLAFSLAALAVLALLFVQKPAELAARGAEQSAELAQLFVYRVPPGQAGQAALGSIRAADALAFAYVNSAGFSRLMIFGEDEHGRVYWYHPAWSDESTNPRAIAIGSGPELRELPESIAHDLGGKSLKIRALFSNSDLSVRDVERALASSPDSLAALARGGREVELTLVVE